ncbi:primosomal protein N' [Shimazuella sp. AN120528]|uniref:primosomal protein N' n=1 Tax=Shimazuella soli TaxID=1892854 RepID=UPI001F115464|nr:primosomal protein N' [Shimazuella soli]MCH5584847.1 primosomal protein N' [Shimazuella soli]
MIQVAKVVVDVPSKGTNRPFDYLVPEELIGEVQIGSRVEVPFGPRKILGYVIGLTLSSPAQKLKNILDVKDILPPLTQELVQLGQAMAEEYFCHTITAFQSMIPSVLKGKYQKKVYLGLESKSFDKKIESLYQLLEKKISCSFEEAERLVGRQALRKSIQDGILKVEEHVGDRVTKERISWVKVKSADLQEIPKRAKKQVEVMQFLLQDHPEVPLSTLLAQTGANRQTVKALAERGLVLIEEREQYRDPYRDATFEPTIPLELTAEQQQAFNTIKKPIQEEQYESILLHGVTGSGKTEIYLQSIEEVLQRGKEAIVLVPEISLTPQMVDRFKGRFGEKVAVLHSRLSAGERYDEWRKIRRGEVQVAIGARSAIFAPFTKLGLVIIDEEHESSYKQEESPRYHAREIARWRAQFHQAAVVLGSATPSLESYFHARTNAYSWVTLKERVKSRPFPTVETVDMREELKQGNRTMFSRALTTSIQETIARGQQVVLFLNRRGYATFVLCRSCGEVANCEHCDIALTYHHTNRTVRCHYCGYTEKVPTTCPKCQSEHIRHFGTGTQKVEEELTKHFPGVRVIRMDMDTTSKKGSHERLLRSFGEGKADILLGTQMIAKGLDFPKVTLVGVIAADTMLNLPDFRAVERTYQLLTQVSGRAGRHEQPGKVIIQTYQEDHYSIQMVSQHESEAFYRKELLLRKQHHYPPFCGLFTITVSHIDRVLAMKRAVDISNVLKGNPNYEVLGPVAPSVSKIKDRHRIQVMVKYPNDHEIIGEIQSKWKIVEGWPKDKELRIQIDRDGEIGVNTNVYTQHREVSRSHS